MSITIFFLFLPPLCVLGPKTCSQLQGMSFYHEVLVAKLHFTDKIIMDACPVPKLKKKRLRAQRLKKFKIALRD